MQNSNGNHHTGSISIAGTDYDYQYRVVSVNHFNELQEEIDALRRQGRLSKSETFQGYLSEMKFTLPENFQDAKFVIIMAIFIKPMMVNFHFDDTLVAAAMPPNYYDIGLTRKMLKDEIQKNILPEGDYRVEWTGGRYHLKLLAVRSGLGKYGRNNICYVDGMGSFLTLHACLTNFDFETDDWGEKQMMAYCHNCKICTNNCPGGAIREDDFVIDINHCLPLYNEVPGEIPGSFLPTAHNAFLGCMKCQFPCPANREVLDRVGQFEDITVEETRQFVNGDPEESVIASVGQKLKIPYLVGDMDMVGVASRNIKALRPQG